MPRSSGNRSPRKANRGKRNQQQRNEQSPSSVEPVCPDTSQRPEVTPELESLSARNESSLESPRRQQTTTESATAAASQSPKGKDADSHEALKQTRKAELMKLIQITAHIKQLHIEAEKAIGQQGAQTVDVGNNRSNESNLDERVPPTSQHEYPHLFTTPGPVDDRSKPSSSGRTKSASSSGRTKSASSSGRTKSASNSGRTNPASKDGRTNPDLNAGGTNPASNAGGTNPASNAGGTNPASNAGGTNPAPNHERTKLASNVVSTKLASKDGRTFPASNAGGTIPASNPDRTNLASNADPTNPDSNSVCTIVAFNKTTQMPAPISGRTLSENLQLAISLASSISEPSSSTSKTSIKIDSPFVAVSKSSMFNSNAMDESFYRMINTKLRDMVECKYYTTIEIIDSKTDLVEPLLGLILEVHYSLQGGVSIAKVQFARKFLVDSGCSSFDELENALFSHKSFRTTLRDYFFIFRNRNVKMESGSKSSPSTSQPSSATGNVVQKSLIEQSQKKSEMNPDVVITSDGHREENESRSNTSSLQSFQPFLGDSSVRPKIKQPKKDDTESQRKKKSKGKEQNNSTTSVRNPNSPARHETASWWEETPSAEATLSKSQNQNEYPEHLETTSCPERNSPKTTKDTETDPGHVGTNNEAPMPAENTARADAWHGDLRFFYQELDLMIDDAIEKKDYNYLQLLESLKFNFRISDLIYVIYITSTELRKAESRPKGSSSESVPDEQDPNFVTDTAHSRTLESEHTHLSSNPAFSAETTGTKRRSNQTVMDFSRTVTHFEARASDVTAISELVASSTETWQSKIRDYHRKLRMNKPLAERMEPKPKAKKLKDEVCPACSKIFRWPHLLHCFHKFCFPCVVKMYENERKCFKCPICLRLTTPVPPKCGPQSLVIDNGFAREMFEANLSPFCCTLCSSTEDAIKFCKHCQEYLCWDCSLLHIKTTATSGHILEKSDMKVGSTPDGQLSHMCSVHPGNLIYKFCATCRKPICNICLKYHGSHIVQELEDAVGSVRERINTINSGINEMQRGYQATLMNLNQSKQRLDSLHRSERRKISEVSNYLISQIDVMKNRSVELLEATADRVKAQALCVKVNQEIYHQKLKAFSEFASKLINEGTRQQTLRMFAYIKQMYHDIAQQYNNPFIRGGFVADLNFDPQYPEVTHSIQETFSSITSEYNCSLTPMLSSPLVRERHHVEPYKPLPYSLDYRYESEIAARESRESHRAATGTDSNTNNGGNLDQFFRYTLPYNQAFGRYGRGEYEFAEPSGILYLHDCSLAVCDTRNHRIVVYNEDGTYQRTIGQPRRIPDLPEIAEEIDRTFQRTDGKLYFPYRLAQCLKTKNIVVVERPPSPGVQVFTFDGRFVRCFGNSYLQNPRGVAVDERGLILVLESKTMNFFIFTPEGDLINKSVLGTLEFPNDVVARQGTIYISDNRHHCVKCFDYSLNYKESIGNESLTYYPISVGFNHNGHLTITDNHNTFNITVFDCSGRVLTGYKSRVKHANCYNVALHPFRPEVVVTTKECQVLTFQYGDLSLEGCPSSQ